MPIIITFKCGGCEAVVKSGIVNREFISLNGLGHGWGHYEYPSIRDAAPEDWMAFDPYTGCCYCPTCWKSIEEHVEGTDNRKGEREPCQEVK